nr:unnamed protein product [Digitaria exilis]
MAAGRRAQEAEPMAARQAQEVGDGGGETSAGGGGWRRGVERSRRCLAARSRAQEMGDGGGETSAGDRNDGW